MKSELDHFTPNGSVDESLLKETELHFGCSLPQQYKSFMSENDGGEGFVGEQYIILWRVNELVEFNNDYEALKYAPGLLLFGSNGGGEAFAFDTRDVKLPIVMVPFIGMSLVDAILVAGSFEDFFLKLADGTFI